VSECIVSQLPDKTTRKMQPEAVTSGPVAGPVAGPAPAPPLPWRRTIQATVFVCGLLLLEEVLRVWALGGTSPANGTHRGWLSTSLFVISGLGLAAAGVAAAVGRVVSRTRAAAAAAAAATAAVVDLSVSAATAIDMSAVAEGAALQVISLAMATPTATLPMVPQAPPPMPAPAPAPAVMCVHDEVCNCIAAVLGPALVEACFKTNPGPGQGSVRPRLVTGNRRALVASISGFLADMVALGGDPRHMALQVTANSTPTLQLRCQIRPGAADGGAPGTAAPAAHWAAIESCYLCPVARRVGGDTCTSQQLASTTLSGDYTLNLGPELRTWRHGPATRQHQAALVAWSAVVVVDDDVTMHRWFQHVFLKKPGASAPTPTPTPIPTPTLLTFGDTATFLAAAQAAPGQVTPGPFPAPRLLDGSVLLFLDLVLPDGDGRDLCHHLRTVCGSEACIVALTSLPATDPTATDAHLAFAGFDAVVRKPVQAAVVAALLRRCGCETRATTGPPGVPQ